MPLAESVLGLNSKCGVVLELRIGSGAKIVDKVTLTNRFDDALCDCGN